MNPKHTSHSYYPFIHAAAQVALLVLFLSQFSFFQLGDVALPACIVSIITIPVIFFRELVAVLNTNSFTRIFFILLLILSICLNLFLVFHWVFSIRELGPAHMFYPWMLTDDFGPNDKTIVNPLIFIACSIAFFSGIILLMGRKRTFRVLGIAVIIFQAAFVVVLSLLERPSFKG